MSEKLTIQDLARGAAERLGMTKGNAEVFAKEFFQLIADALHRDKYVKVKGLGTFKLIDVDSRSSVNVNTGERIEIQGHVKVSFTPDASLRDVINRPFAHFETVPLQNEELLLTTAVDEEFATEEETILNEESTPPQQVIAESPAPMAEEYPPLEEAMINQNDHNEATAADIPSAENPSAGESAAEVPFVEEFSAEATVAEVPLVVEPESEAAVVEESESEAAVAEKSDIEVLAAEEPQTVEETISEEEVHHEPTSSSEEALAEKSPSDEELQEQKNSMKYFIGIVVFISLLCIGVLAFIYFPGLTRALYGLKAPVEQQVDTVATPEPEVSTDTLKPDTLPQSVDSIAQTATSMQTSSKASTPLQEVKRPLQAEKPEKALPVLSDSADYEIVGTIESYTLKEGETLTRVSLHYWGTKKLWPYLVKHNPNIIKNPDNVPYGTTIQIPKLKKK